MILDLGPSVWGVYDITILGALVLLAITAAALRDVLFPRRRARPRQRPVGPHGTAGRPVRVVQRMSGRTGAFSLAGPAASSAPTTLWSTPPAALPPLPPLLDLPDWLAEMADQPTLTQVGQGAPSRRTTFAEEEHCPLCQYQGEGGGAATPCTDHLLLWLRTARHIHPTAIEAVLPPLWQHSADMFCCISQN